MIPFVKNTRLGRWQVAIPIQLVEEMDIIVDERAETICRYIPTSAEVLNDIAEAMQLAPF